VDWTAIAVAYFAGRLSIREIARRQGVTDAAIRNMLGFTIGNILRGRLRSPHRRCPRH
jgi:hypothetical protein